jgi:hypothetical protein
MVTHNASKFSIGFAGTFLASWLIGLCLISFNVRNYLLEDSLFNAIAITFISGSFGGVIYCIRGFYKSLANKNFDSLWLWWYFFRPIMAGVIGVFSYFLIIGGLLSISSSASPEYSRAILLFSSIAFLAGFSFTQFTKKMEDIANTAFSKKEELETKGDKVE